ncbi:MAG: cysteine desulfurase-like protein [Gammaproteobacteria bacterium]
MTYSIEHIRAQYPALAKTDKGLPRIYLDNPAGTQVPQNVVDRMSDCLLYNNANLGGAFVTSLGADSIVDDAHAAMADLLNAASPDEIIFGQNMTTLTLGVSRSIGLLLNPGDEILLSRMDHDANVQPWVLMARDRGVKVKWLPFDHETFEFDLTLAESLMTDKLRLMCVGGASNLLGTLNDVKALCAMARKVGAWSYVDAVQSVPHVSTDVQFINCDFLACSAYKFFGPHQGILYGRQSVLDQLNAYKVRPASERSPGNFESGTQSHEGMAGTAAAVEYFATIGEESGESFAKRYPIFKGRRLHAHTGLDVLFEYESGLAHRLVEGLMSINGITVQGITSPEAMERRVPTVSFTSAQHAPLAITEGLAKQNIFVWSGHNYAIEVVDSLGLRDTGGVVRVGPVHYNTEQEIDQVLNAIGDMH